uniref:NADH-ubiquinone oxidoreductase chain 1 n=1 Tax=Bryozoa sp. TaxID=2813608 RepID=A0AAU8L464_9BILA
MSYFVNIILLILSIAYYTMVERKILSFMMMREGPNKPLLLGMSTPLGDAIKLFSKQTLFLKLSVNFYTFFGPAISFILMLLLWGILPNWYEESSAWSSLWFLGISSLSVYGIFISGWGSNSKFSFLGSIRSIAQTISYEISMGTLLICFINHNKMFDLEKFLYSYPLLISCIPLLTIWFMSSLMETNRAPFDLSEGESELVSGFNTEYGSLKFAMLYLSEYGTMLFLSALTSLMFTGKYFSISMFFFIFCFVWFRSAFPRIRYDILMSFMWKSSLPLVLSMLLWTL